MHRGGLHVNLLTTTLMILIEGRNCVCEREREGECDWCLSVSRINIPQPGVSGMRHVRSDLHVHFTPFGKREREETHWTAQFMTYPTETAGSVKATNGLGKAKSAANTKGSGGAPGVM